REGGAGRHHRSAVDEARLATDQVHAALGEIALVDAVEPQDIGVALLLEDCPVVRSGWEREAVVARIAHALGETGRVPHDFLRHAADVHARAAQAMRFHQGNPGPVLCRALRGGQTAAAAADDNQVILTHYSILV